MVQQYIPLNPQVYTFQETMMPYIWSDHTCCVDSPRWEGVTSPVNDLGIMCVFTRTLTTYTELYPSLSLPPSPSLLPSLPPSLSFRPSLPPSPSLLPSLPPSLSFRPSLPPSLPLPPSISLPPSPSLPPSLPPPLLPPSLPPSPSLSLPPSPSLPPSLSLHHFRK